MATFSEANQAKLSLKMVVSNYSWYNAMSIINDGDDWCVVVHVNKMDNSVRKVVPIVHNGISVKVDVESRTPKK